MKLLFNSSKWVLTMLTGLALMFMYSCGEDDPEPEPVVPPSGLTYEATTIAVGSEGTITATIAGDAVTFEITNQDDVPFASIDAATGVISIAQETTTGTYTVNVTASNSGGSVDGTAEITIGAPAEGFNPVGKGFTWRYFMNQDAPWTIEGLDGEVAKLPIPSVDIPTGWPEGWPALDPNVWNEETLLPYIILGEIQNTLFQVPSDLACEALDPKEGGNTVYFTVGEDLSLSTSCTLNDATGSTVSIGSSKISWADGKFSWELSLASQIPLVYIVDDPTEEQFIDPLDAEPGRTYTAIRGIVEQFITPTNVNSETDILASIAFKKVEVILEVHEL